MHGVGAMTSLPVFSLLLNKLRMGTLWNYEDDVDVVKKQRVCAEISIST